MREIKRNMAAKSDLKDLVNDMEIALEAIQDAVTTENDSTSIFEVKADVLENSIHAQRTFRMIRELLPEKLPKEGDKE